MRRKRTDPKTAESQTEKGQYIGFITTPIADNNLERVRVILARHAVRREKIRSPDNWYTLFLPDGTVKVKKEMEGIAIVYSIHLPDGYQFIYRSPVFNHDKTYHILPQITVLEEQEG